MVDPVGHLTFLKALLDRIPTDTAPDAHVLLLANIAHAKLVYDDVEGTRKDMDAALEILDSLPSVESRVRADYYKVAADYYKAKAEYGPYYRNSLLFLACIDVQDLDTEERLLRAHDLCLSAFLADSIHNFGELVCLSTCCLPSDFLPNVTADTSHS